jgi:hypothetical protein
MFVSTRNDPRSETRRTGTQPHLRRRKSSDNLRCYLLAVYIGYLQVLLELYNLGGHDVLGMLLGVGDCLFLSGGNSSRKVTTSKTGKCEDNMMLLVQKEAVRITC